MSGDWLASVERTIAAKAKERRLACERGHKDEWRVVQRECNHSAFSGCRRTPSAYSEVQCQVPECGRRWRTKAGVRPGTARPEPLTPYP